MSRFRAGIVRLVRPRTDHFDRRASEEDLHR
jgi:hypothetical protein